MPEEKTEDSVSESAKRAKPESNESLGERQGVDDQDDTRLLEAVARHRDREAYARLFRRYQHTLLALAYFVLKDREAAEEAVQEAMLTVWTSASRFVGERGAGAWIKSIVFRKCLQVHRNRGRREQALRRRPNPAQASAPPQDLSEQAESKRVLRSLLDRLPREDQLLVALYAAGELSQDQMAAALSLPQTTISYHLQKSMERLKAGLRSAGFASALPLVSQPGLAEAILQEVMLPPGFTGRVLEAAARLDSSAGRIRPLAPAGAGRSGSSLMLKCAAILALPACLLLWGPLTSGAALPVSGRPVPATGAASGQPAQALGAQEPFNRMWDFNSPQGSEGLTPRVGKWHWARDGGLNGSGCMEMEGEFFLGDFEVPRTPGPFLVTLHLSFRPHARMLPSELARVTCLVTILWARSRKTIVFTSVGKKYTGEFNESAPSWIEYRIFLSQDFSDCWVEGQRRALWAYEEADFGRAGLYVDGARLALDNLSIRRIPAEQLPDLSAYRAALARIPPDMRSGKVALTGLSDAVPGKSIEAIFVTRGHAKGAVTSVPRP